MCKYLIVLLFFASSLRAEEILGKLSQSKIFLGDSFSYTTTIPLPKGATVTLQNQQDWYDALQLHKVVQNKNNFRFLFSAYTPPLCTIPAFSFLVTTTDSSYDISTKPITIIVQTTIPDSIKESKGLRNPLKAGTYPWYYWVFGTVGLIAFIIIILFIQKKLRNKIFPVKVIIPISAYDEAIQSLSSLEKEDILSKGEYKQFAFTLSEILKRYISRRYNALIQEATATEFRRWLATSTLSKEVCHCIDSFLRESEPVKFANIILPLATMEAMLTTIREVVEMTKPIEELPKQEDQK